VLPSKTDYCWPVFAVLNRSIIGPGDLGKSLTEGGGKSGEGGGDSIGQITSSESQLAKPGIKEILNSVSNCSEVDVKLDNSCSSVETKRKEYR